MTKIEWTHRPGTTPVTWNPLVGCSITSPGCKRCYAMTMAARVERMNPKLEHYRGLTQPSNAGPVWTGKINLAPEYILFEPLRWKKPRTVFVNSMSDLFHEDVPDGWIMTVFEIMWRTPQHTYQILTKRSKRMREFMTKWYDLSGENFDEFKDARGPDAVRKAHPSGRGQLFAAYLETLLERSGGKVPAGAAWPTFDWMQGMMWWPEFPPNVWLGVSAERQQEAEARIPDLLATPAAVRFVSAEPLIGPVDLRRWMNDWGCERCGYGGHQTKDHCPNCGWRGDAPAEFAPCPGCAEELSDYYACPECDASDFEGFGPTISGHTLGCIDWVICGGESGPNARPMHPDWARSIRDQCAAAEVPFFFKQWGSWGVAYDRDADDPDWRKCDLIATNTPNGQWLNAAGGQGFHGERVVRVIPMNKTRPAGRLLDGREHSEWPEVAP